MRGATPLLTDQRQNRVVSIHAPHAGRDPFGHIQPVAVNVSIHAPHAGRDELRVLRPEIVDVSIHAPHAGRDDRLIRLRANTHVSIHAPHAGRDGKRGHDFPPLPRIYGYSPPQIRFSRHLRPTPLLQHGSRTYIFTFCFLFTSPSHSVMNAQMMMAASKS